MNQVGALLSHLPGVGRRRSAQSAEFMLRDLVYLDVDKIASVVSQVEGGLPQMYQHLAETSHSAEAGGELNAWIAKARGQMSSGERRSVVESGIPHHDMLARAEHYLRELGLMVDLNGRFPTDPTVEDARALVEPVSYIRAEGWVVLEDYGRMNKIAGEFNELAEFLNRCSVETIKQTPGYLALVAGIDAQRQAANSAADRNQKAKGLAAVRVSEQRAESVVKDAAAVNQVDDWLIKGIGQFTSVFMPDYINLRLYPFESVPEFHVIMNLRHDLFVDSDANTFSFDYGARPNVKLTVLGLVTSLPPKDEALQFDPSAVVQPEGGAESSDEATFEAGFRKFFGSILGFERFVRFSHYPRITVHPLAVYRSVRASTT